MGLPPLLLLPGEQAYRQRYMKEYVLGGPIVTFDGLGVAFYPEQFDHAFFRDSSLKAKDKAIFDLRRAERMPWIRAALCDPCAELYRRPMSNKKVHRIALLDSMRYAVIIQIRDAKQTRARFLTAYVVDSEGALKNMRGNPRW